MLLLLVLAKIFNSERFYDFSRILYSNKYFTSHKKSLQIINRFSFSLFLLHTLLISLGLYLVFKTYGVYFEDKRGVLFFIQIFVAYAIFISVKYFFEKIIGNIFSIEKIIDNYIFYKITYKNFLSLGIFPVLILLVYGFSASKMALLILGSILILSNLLMLLSYYQKNQKLVFTHWFYFILYLCTLEIAPYFILFKVIT